MTQRSIHRLLLVAGLAWAVCLYPAASLGQGGVVSSIIGTVTDQNGMPLKGVKITARSDTQIGGAKVTYSSEEGTFRIPGLQPGTFEVTATAPKLKSVLQKDIKLGVNAAAEVDVIMEVETTVEEVKVVQKAPVVSTTTANVKEVYDADFIDNLPLEQRGLVEQFIGLNTPGATADTSRWFRVRGALSNQNAMVLEGFQLSRERAEIQVYSLAAMEVQTAGFGADYATTSGGVVNMVTKSGSNKFEFDINAWHQDTLLNLFEDQAEVGARSYTTLINPAFSGPIIKDRLWFYLNVEGRTEIDERDPDPAGLLPDPPTNTYYNLRASFKLTWQVTPRNKLQSFTWADGRWNGNDANPGLEYEADAQQKRIDYDYFQGITWESLLTDNAFFKSQFGVQRRWQEYAPERCRDEPINCLHVPQVVQSFPRTIRQGNFHIFEQQINESYELINTLEWFARGRSLGDHDFKLRSRLYWESYELAQTTPGDQILYLNGTTPDRRDTFFANDPRLEEARFGFHISGTNSLTTVHSLSDAMRLTRYLTLNLGGAFTTTHAGNKRQAVDLGTQVVTPHLAVAWDATHDGRTVLRASFNSYIDADINRLARFAQGGRVSEVCRWTAATQQFDNCSFSGGASGRTFGLPCGPSGVDARGLPCKEKFKIPRTWEYTAGAEREIMQGVSLGADLIYRLFTNPYEQRETNRVWNDAGTALSTDTPYRNGKAQQINDLGTPDAVRRRYIGATASLRKRDGQLKTNLAYTWSALEGNAGTTRNNDNENSEYGENPGQDVYLYGFLPTDSRHSVRASMTYQATKWLSPGVTYSYTSGRPYNRRFRNDVTGLFADYRSRVGYDTGGNINDPGDDRALRLPDIQRLNLQLRVNLKPLTGQAFEAYIDAINVLALRTTTAVTTNDGPLFGQTSARTPSTRLRLGMRYRF